MGAAILDEHQPDKVKYRTQGGVTPEIADMHMKMGHPTCKGDIIIENDVWIGAKSSIMSGIKISNGSIVAAGSIITQPLLIYLKQLIKILKNLFHLNLKLINY